MFKELKVHKFNSKLVCGCKITLNTREKADDLSVIWVPGHSLILGNEIGDTRRQRRRILRSDFEGLPMA